MGLLLRPARDSWAAVAEGRLVKDDSPRAHELINGDSKSRVKLFVLVPTEALVSIEDLPAENLDEFLVSANADDALLAKDAKNASLADGYLLVVRLELPNLDSSPIGTCSVVHIPTLSSCSNLDAPDWLEYLYCTINIYKINSYL